MADETAADRFARDHSSQESDQKVRGLDDEPDEREARIYVAPDGTSATGARYNPANDLNNDGNVDASTGATAGIPGSFTPSGDTVPANLAAMTGIVASPGTAWTTGQYVATADAAHVHWNGTAWVAGAA